MFFAFVKRKLHTFYSKPFPDCFYSFMYL